MAISREEAAMYAYITGRVLPKGTTRRAFNLAVAAGIRAAQVAGPLLGRAALGGARASAANPITAGGVLGTGLGLGFLETPPGEELLAMAEERGRADRDRIEFALDFLEGTARGPTFRGAVRQKVKRKTSKYQKGVKAGMKAVKQSKFIGKKGTISNAKKAFSTVSKVTSAVNKGKKVSTKGVTGVIARSVRRILK